MQTTNKAEVNWDPVDQTVLADEQIDDEGKSWRSGAKVEKRYLKQWYIKSTAYSQSLIDGLSELNPEMWKDIIDIQKNWIGESTGTRMDFKLKDNGELLDESLSVFTERPELLCGVSHIIISPNHKLNAPENFKASQQTENESDHMLKITALNPITEEEIPIIVSSSKEFDENNNTILGIPCICEEDSNIAEKFSVSWRNVLSQNDNLINSSQFSDMSVQEGRKAVLSWAKKNKIGGHLMNPKLRDWLISRQRYWGTPIPIIHCSKCQVVPVPADDLPVILPHLMNFSGKGTSPLDQCDEWKNVTCPSCGGPAERETDTMDTFVDSSWYYLRYLDSKNTEEPFSKTIANKHMPVDLYIGGKEHGSKAVEKGTNAPVTVQWEKMSKSKFNGVEPQDVLNEFGTDSTRMCILYNVPPRTHRNWSNVELMELCQSKYNVLVEPLRRKEEVSKAEEILDSDLTFVGVQKWQSKIWSFVSDYIEQMKNQATPSLTENIDKIEADMFDARNFFLKEVTYHFEKTFLLSVAISRMQGLTNVMKKIPVNMYIHSPQFQRALTDLVIMLSPITPHFSMELWTGLASVNENCNTGHDWNKTVFEQTWPVVDKHYKVPLTLKINHTPVSEIKISIETLNLLSLESAFEHFQHEKMFEEHESLNDLSSMTLHIEPSFSAELFIYSSSYTPTVVKEIHDKKVKKRRTKKTSAG